MKMSDFMCLFIPYVFSDQVDGLSGAPVSVPDFCICVTCH
jgi:hypothetical protein